MSTLASSPRDVTQTIRPSHVEELRELLLQSPDKRWVPVGAQSKAPMSQVDEACVRCDMRSMSGIVDYQPADFTITVQAGTPLSIVQTELQQHGQFLPFDPPWVALGSTAGGLVAGGVNGPCKMIWGGLRDFILEVEFMDGNGTLVRGGARVVKNTAGFDFPKFMVGSAGRFGILTTITLKVFPKPMGYLTSVVSYPSFESALAAARSVALHSWDVIASDIDANGSLFLRYAGDETSTAATRDRVHALLGREALNAVTLSEADDQAVWDRLRDHPLSPPALETNSVATLWRVACYPTIASAIASELRRSKLNFHCSHGGNTLWTSTDSGNRESELDSILKRFGVQASNVRGSGVWKNLGKVVEGEFWKRVRSALDPHERFLPLPR